MKTAAGLSDIDIQCNKIGLRLSPENEPLAFQDAAFKFFSCIFLRRSKTSSAGMPGRGVIHRPVNARTNRGQTLLMLVLLPLPGPKPSMNSLAEANCPEATRSSKTRFMAGVMVMLIFGGRGHVISLSRILYYSEFNAILVMMKWVSLQIKKLEIISKNFAR